jgi:WD40 repeat protein
MKSFTQAAILFLLRQAAAIVTARSLGASLVMIGVLGFGALRIGAGWVEEGDPPSEDLDRFGDPLPPGALCRFGTLRFRLGGYPELAFTPDGKQLIAGGHGNPLAVFDAATGRKLRELGANHPQYRGLSGFALAPDGKKVACCGAHSIFITRRRALKFRVFRRQKANKGTPLVGCASPPTANAAPCGRIKTNI